MEHPEVAQVMKTGYPAADYARYEVYAEMEHGIVGGHPEEDLFGQAITQNSVYIIDEKRNVVHVDNIRDYLTEIIGVVFYEAK